MGYRRVCNPSVISFVIPSVIPAGFELWTVCADGRWSSEGVAAQRHVRHLARVAGWARHPGGAAHADSTLGREFMDSDADMGDCRDANFIDLFLFSGLGRVTVFT